MKRHSDTLLRTLLALWLAVTGSISLAAGTVVHLAGTLTAKQADGTVKILGRNSNVETGDTLATEKDSYAMVKFTDGGTLTLKPNTQLKIEGYVFEQSAPLKDSFIFNLVKGGLRALTGLVGKRGNQDAFRANTITATIGVRGTHFGLDVVAPGGEGEQKPGVYLAVFDGVAVAFNEAGFRAFEAGQWGFIQSINTPPQLLPADPGFKFTPPANFGLDTPQACVIR